MQYLELDSIEYCRGQLSAMAYVSPSTAREVHIQKLQHSFERAGIIDKLLYSVRVLNLMREVQKLGNGYWFPTPMRIIPIDDEMGIIVGPASTGELQHHFGSVTRAGYARVLLLSDARDLPIQKLDDWLGLNVEDTIAWTKDKLLEAYSNLKETILPEKVQYFGVRTIRSNLGNITIPVWTDTTQSSLQSKGMMLCRERHRYFFVKTEGRVFESYVDTSVVGRLCFGLAALIGTPITVTIERSDSVSIFHTPRNLPRSERQLILALGTRDMSLPGMAYRVSDDSYVSLIEAMLRNIGCEVRKING